MAPHEGSLDGTLIVIDGTDGAGKATQTNLLYQRLLQEGYSVVQQSFPRYGEKSAGPIELYLNEADAPISAVDPYQASVLYAVDRFFAKFTLVPLLQKNNIVLLDRYVAANAGHQGGKISNDTERHRYLKWLYDFEFYTMGIPKPNFNIILYLPPEIGQQRVALKKKRDYLQTGTHDAHEKDIQHLINAAKSYLWLAENYREEYHLIRVVQEDGYELSESEVHEQIWKLLGSVRARHANY